VFAGMDSITCCICSGVTFSNIAFRSSGVVYFTASNFAVSMDESTYNTANYQDHSEYNDVYHAGRGYYSYYHDGYLYSGYAPTPHISSDYVAGTIIEFGKIFEKVAKKK
jgi:hypothetical protein